MKVLCSLRLNLGTFHMQVAITISIAPFFCWCKSPQRGHDSNHILFSSPKCMYFCNLQNSVYLVASCIGS